MIELTTAPGWAGLFGAAEEEAMDFAGAVSVDMGEF
jgi:hypothetical protein